MQQLGDSPGLLQASFNGIKALRKRLWACQIVLSQSIHHIEIHLDDHKVLTDAVVQITAKSTPFLILGLQQADGEPPQRSSSFLDQAFELRVAQPQRRFGLFTLSCPHNWRSGDSSFFRSTPTKEYLSVSSCTSGDTQSQPTRVAFPA
jgi:hypothetical protein